MKDIASNIKNLFKKMDKTLLILTMLFFLFGLLNIVTASSREAVVRYRVSTYHYFYKQSFMLILGLILSYIIINLKTSTYKRIIPIVYMICLGLVISLFFFGSEVNGAKNWLPIPGLGTIQPSEFSKPVIIIFVSVLFDSFYTLLRSKNEKRYGKIAFILGVALIIPLLTFLQKDLGSAVIMIFSFGVIFLVSPIKRLDKLKIMGALLVLAILGFLVIYFKQGYILSPAQKARLDFFNPCSKYETTGYQVCNGFIAINDGGLFGLGIGKSKQKYSYIPEPHTDSIFAIIAEEYGVLGTTIIFICYIIVIFRILKISQNTNKLKNKYIALGIASYIFIHIFINLGGLFGIIPLTGVPLPFLSYGGSYAISLMCSLAVVQRIYIETRIDKSKKSPLK